MKTQIISYLFVCFLIQGNYVTAQQEEGQICINAGVGDSPGFDNPGSPFFFTETNSNIVETGFSVSNIIPNIGCTIDYNITNYFSIGAASSYQSEIINVRGAGSDIEKITRISLNFRTLFHLNKRNRNKFDHYIGTRFGLDYWGDVFQNGSSGHFLTNPNQFIPSFQVFYGMRIYFTNNIGVQCEVGIGEPYLAEGGLTFRINT